MGTDFPEPAEELRHEFSCSESIAKIGAALAKAQAKIGHADKGQENPHFNRSYADLADVTDACRAALTGEGIAVYQAPMSRGPEVGVRSMLIYEGEYLANTVWAKPVQNSPQAIGSVITYLRRYSLAANAWVAPRGEDDDGNAGTHGPNARKEDRKEEPKPKAEKKGKGEPPAVASEPPVVPQAPPPVKAPAGQVAVFVSMNGKWEQKGFAPQISEERRGRIKGLQRELGVGEDEWKTKLSLLYGKASSTALSEPEGVDLEARLQARKTQVSGPAPV